MDSVGDMFMDSPRSEEALFQKYLPYNNPHDDDDDVDPYSADQFRMYEFKVRRCTRSRSHDWTDCPFAHPGEKARRRDPRRYHYSGTVCPEFRRGGCPRGDNCEFAHGVFECWLHPARYRTEACKDGKNCKRKVCFFAHTAKQLRILPSDNYPVSGGGERKYRTSTGGGQHCCAHCHCAVASPTSILMAMPDLSPPASPPVSPIHKSRQIGGFSPVSRFNDRLGNLEMNHHHPGLSYKDTLIELMTSLESMGVSEHSPRTTGGGGGGINNLTWMDVSTCDDPQFIMSPSAPSPSRAGFGSSQFARRNKSISFVDENGAGGAPDLGWVNDLLT